MKSYARWLFGTAAAGNLAVGGSLLLAQKPFAEILGLDPIVGSNAVIAALAGVLIVVFGYGYGRIALDPARFRPLIQLGAFGKLAAVVTVVVGARLVPHVWWLAVLVSGDLGFAALFLDYLRRTARRADA